MGAPKQKWTAEEESALKAGIAKHGAGKWRTILRDPEFSSVLRLRSNVDLKDKWRNMNVTATGLGSREKGRVAFKKSRPSSRHSTNSISLSSFGADGDKETIDVKPFDMSSEALQIPSPKACVSRMDDIIVEAILTLKEPSGSFETAIATFIEEHYWPPSDFKGLLSAKLQALTASGKLIKVKRKYKIASTSPHHEEKVPGTLLLEDGKVGHPIFESDDEKPLSKDQIDAELALIRSMTKQEAAAAAARAVAEAERLMAEVELAEREAQAAEADAEAAQAFAEAARLTLQRREGNRQT